MLYIATEALEMKKLELEATKLEWEKHHKEQNMELEQQKLAQESEQWKTEREDSSFAVEGKDGGEKSLTQCKNSTSRPGEGSYNQAD